jgi:hypothetical protein
MGDQPEGQILSSKAVVPSGICASRRRTTRTFRWCRGHNCCLVFHLSGITRRVRAPAVPGSEFPHTAVASNSSVSITTKGWNLWGEDADRYVRADKRFLSLLIRMGDGSVPSAFLGRDTAGRNAELRAAVPAGQFNVFLRHGGRVPGFALLSPWSRIRGRPLLRTSISDVSRMAGCPTG